MPITALDIAELRQRLTSGFGPIEAEVMGEKASSLGHHGRQVERTIAALEAFDPATGTSEHRTALVKAAAQAVWKYFVQREACGLRNHKDAIQLYGIPGEVLARLGAIEK